MKVAILHGEVKKEEVLTNSLLSKPTETYHYLISSSEIISLIPLEYKAIGKNNTPLLDDLAIHLAILEFTDKSLINIADLLTNLGDEYIIFLGDVIAETFFNPSKFREYYNAYFLEKATNRLIKNLTSIFG